MKSRIFGLKIFPCSLPSLKDFFHRPYLTHPIVRGLFRFMGTHFLNVDMEIESHQNLQPIVEGLGDNVINLYCGNAQGHYLATFELSDVSETDPDSVIYNFCLLIENLEDEIKKLWDSAFAKVFDIGYEGGSQPSSYSSEISSGTIEKISMLGASIRVTIYPPNEH